MLKTSRFFLIIALFCQFGALAQGPKMGTAKTALDRYVEAPDPSYKYELVKTVPGKGYTTFILDMTSQTWRSTTEVDRNVWKHWVVIVKPDVVENSKSLLFISGGGNGGPPPQGPDKDMANIATATKSVVTDLRMIPNQPLTFADDGKARTEDAMIAYTWDKYLKTGDDSWPARLPMTKAAVRAMDAVTDFLGSSAGGRTKIDGFVVSGGSKRGWTTWTTAAVDKRVVAIIPIVIDLLNIVPSFEHHYRTYGYFAPAVGDYEEMGIMNQTGTERYRSLMKIVEPYEYRDRFVMPKFIMNATGDQFFLPDSWKFYYQDLPGVKYLRYVPNTDHSMRGSDAFLTVLACYNAVLTNRPLPVYDWKIQADGSTVVETKTAPTEVKLWQASNAGARDFRLTTIGPRWTSTILKEQSPGKYVAKVPVPRKGYTAYMVELTYPSGIAAAPFKFTTGVKVLPDVEPLAGEPMPGPKAK